MRRWIVLAALVACGRWNFAARTSDGGGDARAIDAGIPGLVAWFPLEDTTGDTFEDVVGGVVGTCAGSACPTAAAGHRGQGYHFDGVGNCIAVPDVSGHFDLPDLTVAIWANQDAQGQLNGTSQTSKRVDVQTDVLNTWELEDYDTGQLAFTSNHDMTTNVQILSADATIVPLQWQHLAITWDSASEMKMLYIDGMLSAQTMQSGALAYDSHGVMIGCDDNTGISEPYNGTLDELQIYDRALTPAEIAELAAE